MNTKIKWSGVFFLTTLFSLTSMAAQAQSILVSAESGSDVPIEGTWAFPDCGPDDEYGGVKDIQEFLIFTGDQVEGRVVQYDSEDETCTGEETIVESETGTVMPGGTETDTCWDGGVPPPRQDSQGNLAENPAVTRLIYLLDNNETEIGLFYIDDTAETWYLWRNGGEDDNGGGEDLTLAPACAFPMSPEEPLHKVSPAMVSVTIDIKPGSDPNSVNPRSKGVIPVAVLGSIDFDATQVDPTTVTFGPNGASPAHNGHIEDVNDDGFMDAVFHFRTQETGIVCGDTEATLNGETFDETSITGTDTVSTVGCKNKSSEESTSNKTVDDTTSSSAGAVSWVLLVGLGMLGLWRVNRRRYVNG